MDALRRIQEIRNSHAGPLPSEIEDRLRAIESRYSFSSSLSSAFTITADPTVMEELEDISRCSDQCAVMEPVTEPVTEPLNEPVQPAETVDDTFEDTFIKDSIKRLIQSLSRIPNPIPNYFDRDAYNHFVAVESKDILKKVREDSLDLEGLLAALCSLEAKPVSFIKEPHRTKLSNSLSLFEEHLRAATGKDRVMLATLVNRIKTADAPEELDAFVQKYSTQRPQQPTDVSLTEKDITILQSLRGWPTQAYKVAEVMGLTAEECRVLLENLDLHKKMKENSSRLTRNIGLPLTMSGALL